MLLPLFERKLCLSILRKRASSSALLMRRQPFYNQCLYTRPFSTPCNLMNGKRTFATKENENVMTIDFLEKLSTYKTGDPIPSAQLLMKVINADPTPNIILQTLQHEQRFPECKGLILITDAIEYVVQACIQRGHAEQADELLRALLVQKHRVTARAANLVLNAYCENRSNHALFKAEELVKLLEEARWMTVTHYYVLIKAYWAILGNKDALEPVQALIARMETDKRNKPTAKIYNALAKLHVARGDPPALVEEFVQRVSTMLQKEEDVTNLNITAMRAWAKSSEPEAMDRAWEIYESKGTGNERFRAAWDEISAEQERMLDSKTYLDKLEAYEKGELDMEKPKIDQLKGVLRAVRYDWVEAKRTLDRTVAFVTRFPECRDLLDRNCFLYGILTCIDGKQVDAADQLLTQFRELGYIQPDEKCFSLVMNAYADLATSAAVKKVEALLRSLEEQALTNEEHNTADISTSNAELNLSCRHYNIMSKAYIRVLPGSEAVELIKQTYERMASMAERLNNRSMRLNSVSYSLLMRAYMLKGGAGCASEIQTLLDDFKAMPNVQGELMTMYRTAIEAWIKSDDPAGLERARDIFNGITYPDTRCYGDIIAAYIQRNKIEDATLLLNQMLESFNTGANRTCEPTNPFYIQLLSTLQKSRNADALKNAEKFFSLITFPDTVCYTILMDMYTKHGRPEAALELFQKMLSEYESGRNTSCSPSPNTYSTVLVAMEKAHLTVEEAVSLVASMRSPDSFVYNNLLNMYANSDKFDHAFSLFRKMKADFESGVNDQCRPDTVTFNTLLKAVQKSSSQDLVENAEFMFESMKSDADRISYATMLRIYAKSQRMDKAMSLFKRMTEEDGSGRKTKSQPDVLVYNTMLDLLKNSEEPNAVRFAMDVFSSIEAPDVVTYNTMLNILANRGYTDEAIELFNRMNSDFESGQNKGCRPSPSTYNTLLKAFKKSKRSDAVASAAKLFSSIPYPDTFSYNTLISIYARRGNVDKALSLLDDMKASQTCKPDVITYNTVLSAFAKSWDSAIVPQAERFFESIAIPNTKSYHTLLDVYKKHGLADEAKALVHRMRNEYDTKRNRTCQPNAWTSESLNEAIRNSQTKSSTRFR
jgi:pentatricopeptide repeat protein